MLNLVQINIRSVSRKFIWPFRYILTDLIQADFHLIVSCCHIIQCSVGLYILRNSSQLNRVVAKSPYQLCFSKTSSYLIPIVLFFILLMKYQWNFFVIFTLILRAIVFPFSLPFQYEDELLFNMCITNSFQQKLKFLFKFRNTEKDNCGRNLSITFPSLLFLSTSQTLQRI